MTVTNTTAARTTAVPQTIALFSGKALAWITFWLSAPVGLVLMAHNYWELGQRDKMIAYFGAAAVALVVITGMWLLPSPFDTLTIFATNIVTLFHLLTKSEIGEARGRTAGNRISHRNGWLALLVALLLALALSMVANVLLAIIFG